MKQSTFTSYRRGCGFNSELIFSVINPYPLLCGIFYIAVILLINSNYVHAEPRPLPPVVNHSTYQGGNKPSGGRNSSSPQSLYETLGRLEQLQAEVQQLRGIVEEQDFTIIELKKRIKNIYLDVDQRLLSIENSGEISPETSSEFEQPVKPDNQQVSQPNSSTSTPAQANAPAQEKPDKNEKQDYQTAHETLVNGHTGQAIKLFQQYLLDFPNGQFSANAQYWLGEAYSIKQDFNSARKALNRVISVHPGSSKVADAMLKLGYLEAKTKNPVKAREWLTSVTVKYPGTTAAHLATKKLRQLN